MMLSKSRYDSKLSVIKMIPDFVIQNRIHVAFCAVTAAWSCAVITSTPVQVSDLFVVFIIMFGIYQWNMLTDRKEDDINCPDRAQSSSFGLNWTTISIVTVFAFCIFYSLAYGNPEATLILAGVIFLGIFYSTTFNIFGGKRLKNIPIVKNITSALGWMLLTVLYPAFQSLGSVQPEHWLVAVLIFLNVWMVELIWDIRDQEGDGQTNIKTIPVLYGTDTTRYWIFVLNLLSFLILLAGYFGGRLTNLWLLFCINNLMIFLWISAPSILNTKRIYSHLLVTLQTILLFLLGLSSFHLT